MDLNLPTIDELQAKIRQNSATIQSLRQSEDFETNIRKQQLVRHCLENTEAALKLIHALTNIQSSGNSTQGSENNTPGGSGN